MVKEYEASFGHGENVLKSIVMMLAQFSKYTKNHWTVWIKSLSCMMSELYLNTLILKRENCSKKSIKIF